MSTHATSLRIHVGGNLPVLESMPSVSVDLIYIDPPFNTDYKGWQLLYGRRASGSAGDLSQANMQGSRE